MQNEKKFGANKTKTKIRNNIKTKIRTDVEANKVKKKKDIRRKYRTWQQKRRNRDANLVAVNQTLDLQYLTKQALTSAEYEEHKHVLMFDDIRAIVSLQRTWKEKKDIEMPEDAIPTKVLKLIINTLGSDAITPKEQQLGYFTRNKLRKANTQDQWLAGKTKQIDQFMHQGMFGVSRSLDTLRKNAIILRPHQQYLVKQNGVRRSRMCYNRSKKSTPQLYAVASTWSSCVLLPMQRSFLRMCVDLGLVIYGGEATDAYAHSPALNDTFLSINKAYADWYKPKFNKKID